MKATAPAQRGREPGIGFADRLLAEAVRVFERDGARSIDDPRAEARAVEAGGDFEHRIAVRARSLDAAPALGRALRQTRQVIGVIMAFGVLLAALAGAGAARAALAPADDAPVNVYWALGGLLGSCHALELGFLFGTNDSAGIRGFSGSGAAADALERAMQDSWIAFARSADPSCQALGSWPAYGERRETMILDEKCRVELAPYEEERSAWEGLTGTGSF